MKNLNLLTFLLLIFCFQFSIAQTVNHLTISDDYPKPGEKLTFTYDPVGTNLEKKTDISAIVYYLDNKDFPAFDLDLKPADKKFTFETTVPSNAKAFFVRISSADSVDNNDGKGYFYFIYNNKTPDVGAFAEKAYYLSFIGKKYANIKIDEKAGIALYQQEFNLHPESRKDFENKYYYFLGNNAEYAQVFKNAVDSLIKNGNEEDLWTASNLLKKNKKIREADSVCAVMKSNYPNGILYTSEKIMRFLKEYNLQKQDSLYNSDVKNIPEKPGTDQDLYLQILASKYSQYDDINNFYRYANPIKEKTIKAQYFNDFAARLASFNKLNYEAEKLSKISLDIIFELLANPTPNRFQTISQAKNNYRNNFYRYMDTYNLLLFKEGKIEDAFKNEQTIIDNSKKIDIKMYEHYLELLGPNKQHLEAKDFAESLVKSGKGTEILKEQLKKDYIKTNGSEKGFEQYMVGFESSSLKNELPDLAEKMINIPAPPFSLNDINGNSISSYDLKGKIVILDFWATWCSPCKASFPGMQLAVNKYKDNPNIKFLFVDSWEYGDNYLEGVKKFIGDNKYSFTVLLDEKGNDGRQAKVGSSFGVSSIPTKFIIDKNGNIRFAITGAPDNPEEILEEVTNMIALVK